MTVKRKSGWSSPWRAQYEARTRPLGTRCDPETYDEVVDAVRDGDIMSKNFIQPGDTVTLTAPSGGVTSGSLIIVGTLAGVCAFDAAAGAPVEVTLTGVWQLPKASGAFTQGAAVSWDNAAHNVAAPGTGKYPIGVCILAAATGDTVATVRLNGTPTVAA
jgi:predicted RecA/RadA family phage recombinase